MAILNVCLAAASGEGLVRLQVVPIECRQARVSLSENGIKEQLSYAYVHAIAARAGFSANRLLPDNDSVDVQIDYSGWLVPESKSYSPSLRMQLKATSALGKTKSKIPDGPSVGDYYPFDLSMKNYNDLRANRITPLILVVFFMPLNEDNWLSHTEKGMVTRRCAYWCSLRDQPPIANVATKTVYVPKANVLNCESLRGLMVGISKGILP